MYDKTTKMGELLSVSSVVDYLKTAAPEYLDPIQGKYVKAISIGAIMNYVTDDQKQVLQTVLQKANEAAK